ncbi:MAG TPA: DUF418 domain-containing protein [Cyclobacteriaceae bacterium]|nr:DUF418 domain-containing protein [Cyclobacteriaceae bacterium]
MSSITPTIQSERIVVLDILRGIAILGILLMNMPSFSLPGVVGHDPSTLNESGINYYIWYVVNWAFDGTQRALFSILFGAGILLFVGRKENEMDGLKPADYFFRRQIWLIVLSLFDVYILLWNGDILFDYACYGMLLFTFRKLAPKTLLIAAGICFVLILARDNRDLYEQKKMITRGEIAAAIDTTKTNLTPKQKDELGAMTAFRERFTKESKLKRMETSIEKVSGSYESVYDYRTSMYVDNLIEYTYFQCWDVLMFMLFGMALFKMGILTGNASIKIYFWMTVIGLGAGLTLSYFQVQTQVEIGFNWFDYMKEVPFQYYQITRALRTVGIFGVIMLLYKSGWFTWFFSMLRSVGQMALTNYLTQSLICSIIFNGFAFGLFGKLQRYEIYLVVLGIWLFQIAFCNVWMRYFLFGPFEWVWRSLTYWKKQAFVKGL